MATRILLLQVRRRRAAPAPRRRTDGLPLAGASRCGGTAAGDLPHRGHLEFRQIDSVMSDGRLSAGWDGASPDEPADPRLRVHRPVTSTRLPTAARSCSSAIFSSLYMATLRHRARCACRASALLVGSAIRRWPPALGFTSAKNVVLERARTFSATFGARPGTSFSRYTHPVRTVEVSLKPLPPASGCPLRVPGRRRCLRGRRSDARREDAGQDDFLHLLSSFWSAGGWAAASPASESSATGVPEDVEIRATAWRRG